MFYQLIEKSWGWMAVAWTKKGLAGLNLPEVNLIHSLELWAKNFRVQEHLEGQLLDQSSQLEKWLAGYFTGQPFELYIQIDWSGYTPFQKQVLKAARQIPYGQVRSYRQIAEMIGKPQAARAVGNALSANRHLLVVPCHRVIRQNGTLGGFGGRPEYKERLLKWEGCSLYN